MGRTLVKICGVTRVEDALAAARLGADFVGMVLHADSPRKIAPDRARQIIDTLPRSVTPVGVFVDARADDVVRTCDELGLNNVQLHGNETVDYVRGLGRLSVWKVLSVDQQFRARLTTWRSERLNAILCDATRGGSGVENDWHALADARDTIGGTRFIAAGGLTPENVRHVVRLLRPWAVDVSSGVEGPTRGIKSSEKIDSFIRAVRAADESA